MFLMLDTGAVGGSRGPSSREVAAGRDEDGPGLGGAARGPGRLHGGLEEVAAEESRAAPGVEQLLGHLSGRFLVWGASLGHSPSWTVTLFNCEYVPFFSWVWSIDGRHRLAVARTRMPEHFSIRPCWLSFRSQPLSSEVGLCFALIHSCSMQGTSRNSGASLLLICCSPVFGGHPCDQSFAPRFPFLFFPLPTRCDVICVDWLGWSTVFRHRTTDRRPR